VPCAIHTLRMSQKNVLGIRGFVIFLNSFVCMYTYMYLCSMYVHMYEHKYVYLQTIPVLCNLSLSIAVERQKFQDPLLAGMH
jgi:hypothetical protein